LVQKLAIFEERPAQDAFLDGPSLRRAPLPRPLATAARPRGGGLPSSDREVDDHLGAVDEHPGAPERGAEREAPFGGREARFELAHLEETDRGLHPCGTTAKHA
jgi:hypothetical protein